LPHEVRTDRGECWACQWPSVAMRKARPGGCTLRNCARAASDNSFFRTTFWSYRDCQACGALSTISEDFYVFRQLIQLEVSSNGAVWQNCGRWGAFFGTDNISFAPEKCYRVPGLGGGPWVHGCLRGSFTITQVGASSLILSPRSASLSRHQRHCAAKAEMTALLELSCHCCGSDFQREIFGTE
jgi:hypothetical protein